MATALFATLVLGLGEILEAPVSAVVPLGSNATFSCRVVGNVFWAINGLQISNTDFANAFAVSDIHVPLSTPNHSEVAVTATTANNGTTVRCFVEEYAGALAILNSSATVLLKAYGKCRRVRFYLMVARFAERLEMLIGPFSQVSQVTLVLRVGRYAVILQHKSKDCQSHSYCKLVSLYHAVNIHCIIDTCHNA